MTPADRLHSNQVLSTRGSILSFSWCFTEVASIIFGFFSSRSYPCFLFLSRQSKILFTLIDSGRQAIKGIMIVQLSSKNWRNITLVRPYVWMVFTHVPCGTTLMYWALFYESQDFTLYMYIYIFTVLDTYDYDYPTNSYSAPTHLFLFFLFLESTGHHNLDDKAAYHLPRNRHWLFDLVQPRWSVAM